MVFWWSLALWAGAGNVALGVALRAETAATSGGRAARQAGASAQAAEGGARAGSIRAREPGPRRTRSCSSGAAAAERSAPAELEHAACVLPLSGAGDTLGTAQGGVGDHRGRDRDALCLRPGAAGAQLREAPVEATVAPTAFVSRATWAGQRRRLWRCARVVHFFCRAPHLLADARRRVPSATS